MFEKTKSDELLKVLLFQDDSSIPLYLFFSDMINLKHRRFSEEATRGVL